MVLQLLDSLSISTTFKFIFFLINSLVNIPVPGPISNKLLYPLYDIDKWNLWRNSIVDEVKSVDYAFLDATFFSGDEINRSMKEIHHPFVLETIDNFMDEDLSTKNKIYFIHFNHTNPLLNQKINLRDSILKLGFNFAKFGDKYNL